MAYLSLNLLGNGKTIPKVNIGLKELIGYMGEDDAPDLGDACTDLLVIRVVDEGKNHTVFVE